MSDGATALSGAFFNVATEAVVISSGGSWSATTAEIKSVGNGWYRCTVCSTRNAGTVTTAQIYSATSMSSVTHTGDGTSGIYIWGAQLEVGAFATSYISTTTAQATRAVDSAVMTGTNFSSWYRQDEGTVLAKADSNSPAGSAAPIASIENNATHNRVQMLTYSNLVSVVDTTVQVAFGVNTLPNVLYATAFKENDFALSVSGGAVATDIAGSLSKTMDVLLIGCMPWGNYSLNGHISKLAYYPKRLSNAELQSITTQ
jgi:hypothetical protein